MSIDRDLIDWCRTRKIDNPYRSDHNDLPKQVPDPMAQKTADRLQALSAEVERLRGKGKHRLGALHDEIITMRKAGSSIADIGRSVGMTKSGVHAVLRRAGLTGVTKVIRWNDRMDSSLSAMMAAKLPITTICKRFGFSRNAIVRRCKILKINLPRASQALKGANNG